MIWTEWGRLTRFLESARIAFARESQLWESLELADASSAKIRTENGKATYQVSLEQHRQAVSDTWLLNASILLSYYALAEAAAADKLGLDDVTDVGGIEVWGQRLLDAAAANWHDVKDGKAGAVEVAVVRNAIAHGDRTYTQRSINRLQAAGVQVSVSPGAPLQLDYTALHEYRARLKSLLRVGQVRGAVGDGES
ncbi:hypothetical protein [Tepidimonas charontis]|uniref:hypothetical protein n=1 Tax=Tepidimonas charontis TaxID=2267262 RepID=UPI001185C387|nr:hypothetical protein [Tepidimonas charontis]